VAVCLEVPFDRLGLPLERAHSLRLEPGCCVLVKMVARLLEHQLAGAGLLQPASVSHGDRRRLVLPAVKFTVLKAKPGELDKHISAAARCADTEVTSEGEFALRWSLEHLLNSLLPSILAVESCEHLPEKVARCTSFCYVRELHQHLPIDSEDYGKQESLDTARKKALEVAVAEAASGPKSQRLDSVEEQQDADSNMLLRLLHFVCEQVEVATQRCMVCHRPMDFIGVKPFVCSQSLCVHQFENLNLGANIELEVEKNPEVVDLLVSLAFHHFSKSLTLGENAPSWNSIRAFWWGSGTLEGGPDSVRLLGTDVDFEGQLVVGDSIRIRFFPSMGMCVQQQRTVTRIEEAALEVNEPFTLEVDQAPFEILWQEQREHPWDAGYECAQLINKLPSIKMMQCWLADGFRIQDKLDEKDGRLFCVLRWILCSFRGHLRFLDGESSSDNDLPYV
jgi:hypothetical protein